MTVKFCAVPLSSIPLSLGLFTIGICIAQELAGWGWFLLPFSLYLGGFTGRDARLLFLYWDYVCQSDALPRLPPFGEEAWRLRGKEEGMRRETGLFMLFLFRGLCM